MAVFQKTEILLNPVGFCGRIVLMVHDVYKRLKSQTKKSELQPGHVCAFSSTVCRSRLEIGAASFPSVVRALGFKDLKARAKKIARRHRRYRLDAVK